MLKTAADGGPLATLNRRYVATTGEPSTWSGLVAP
jgi:hypothetical protein